MPAEAVPLQVDASSFLAAGKVAHKHNQLSPIVVQERIDDLQHFPFLELVTNLPPEKAARGYPKGNQKQ